MNQNKYVNENDKPNVLLDRAIEICSLKNDAALCRLLGAAPPVISKMRHGKLPIGATMLINLHEKTGMSIGEMKSILRGAP